MFQMRKMGLDGFNLFPFLDAFTWLRCVHMVERTGALLAEFDRRLVGVDAAVVRQRYALPERVRLDRLLQARPDDVLDHACK